MSRLLIGVSAIALCLPAATRAQEALDLAPITIYGNITDLPLSRTGASVEVVDEDALRDAPSQSLAETLANVPGVSFTRAGGPGQPSFVRLRGLPQRYAPVLLNGIEISDPSGVQSQFDWANILAGGVRRAEIVKGSQSALYGADAVAGVIALTAAQAPESPGREGEITLEAGANQTRAATLSYGIAGERAGLAFSAAHYEAQSPSAVTSGSDVGVFEFAGFTFYGQTFDYSEDDPVRQRQLSFDAYLDVTDDIRLGLTGFAQRSESDFDQAFGTIDTGTGALIDDPETGEADTRQQGLRAYAEFRVDNTTHTFEVSRFTIDRDSTSTFGTSEFAGEREKIAYMGEWDSGTGTVLSFGASREIEDADGSPEEVETYGSYVELVYAATPDLDLAASIRKDNHSAFGDFIAARGALSWRVQPDLTLRASVSNGFRAPSLYELYDPTYGDGALDPEESVSVDLGIEKTYGNGAAVSATLFRTEVDDLIIFDGTLGPMGRYAQSDGTSITQGLEIAARYPVADRVALTGAFTYTDTRDADDDPLPNVARYDLALGATAEITDALSGSLTLRHLADLSEVSNAAFTAREAPDDFTVVNAQTTYSFDNGVEAYLRIENLFDADYEVIPDYNAPGRSAFFGVRASF